MAGALEAFAERARAAGRFGVDTEFVGEGRYRTLLCLIQLVLSDAQGLEVLVVDTVENGGTDLAPLADLLSDPAIEVVVHAGRQDVALLRREARCEINTLFDTQLAAGFAGLQAQAGYDTLLRELLGVKVQKTASYTRWDRRPLSPEQMAYAREDVLHLLELAGELERRLSANGRLEWAREECRVLEHASDERDPDSIFARLPRINSLSAPARAIARELVEWRERLAEEQDRPVSTVLNDAALVELAKRRPATPAELEQVRGVNPGSLKRRGAMLLDAIARGAEREPIPIVPSHHEPRVQDDAPLIALCEALIRGRVLEARLAYELVASRAELQELVTCVRANRPEPDVRALRGWRRALVGDELLELLSGHRSLGVEDGRIRIVVS